MFRAQLWADSLGVPYSAQTWKVVCSEHFSEADFTSPECIRLNRMVVPTVCATSSHSHSTPQPRELHFSTPPVSSSSPLVACPDYLPVQKPIKTYSNLSIRASKTFSSTEPPSIPHGCVNEIACGGELGSVSLQSSSPKRKARHSILKKLDLDIVAELKPRKKKLYNMIQTRETALCKLRKKYRAKKLKEVCQLESNPLIESLSSSLNVDTSRFLASIARNSKHEPKGRRWSFKENVLAISILQRSPRSYAFLRSLFPLPSRITLQSLLNTVQYGTGINAHVFSVLKDSVQTMSDKDRVCCLMFDEMSIRQHLHLNQKSDCIEGFEDLGRHDRTSNMANHALAFMLRGLRKRWKQPVAYYLTHGSTNGKMLVNFLRKVLDACHSASLVVVATVCDMVANNVKALKYLGVSEKTPFFTFRDKEIAAVFDPPHLLKCTRNQFLKHDVMNVRLGVVVNGQPLIGTAKWADILKVYKIDKQNVLYRVLHNVTDRHLKPFAQDAMKVSLAAQVMSTSVAATIDTHVTAGKEKYF
jgi:hypothetical protein